MFARLPGPAGRCAPRRRRAMRRGLVRLARECLLRGGFLAFVPERVERRARAARRWLPVLSPGARRGFGAAFRARFRSRRRSAELDARASSLRQSDRDRLLRVLHAVLTLADVMDLLAHELSGLRRCRLPCALVLTRAPHRFLLRHTLPPKKDMQRSRQPQSQALV